jgi:8-oxo-dGTP diphosphatase
MSDSEILEHCGEDIRDEPFIISSVPHPRRTEGFPLDSLSVEIASGKYYYDLYGRRSGSERRTAGFQAFFKRAAGV